MMEGDLDLIGDSLYSTYTRIAQCFEGKGFIAAMNQPTRVVRARSYRMNCGKITAGKRGALIIEGLMSSPTFM